MADQTPNEMAHKRIEFRFPNDVISFLRDILSDLLFVFLGMLFLYGQQMKDGKPLKDPKFRGRLIMSFVFGIMAGRYAKHYFPDYAEYIYVGATIFANELYKKVGKWFIDKFSKSSE